MKISCSKIFLVIYVLILKYKFFIYQFIHFKYVKFIIFSTKRTIPLSFIVQEKKIIFINRFLFIFTPPGRAKFFLKSFLKIENHTLQDVLSYFWKSFGGKLTKLIGGCSFFSKQLLNSELLFYISIIAYYTSVNELIV